MSILSAPARPVGPGLGYLTDVEFLHLSAAVDALREGRACVRRTADEVLAHMTDPAAPTEADEAEAALIFSDDWAAGMPAEPESDPLDWPSWTDAHAWELGGHADAVPVRLRRAEPVTDYDMRHAGAVG